MNAAIHYTTAQYGRTTACGRPIDRVACWDDYDAVTCKHCLTKHERNQAGAATPEQTSDVDALAAMNRQLARESGERVTAQSTDHRKEAQLFAGYLTGAAYDTEQQLDHVTSLIEQAELHRAELVARARREGLSWQRIGQSMGLTKQAAQQRYGKMSA